MEAERSSERDSHSTPKSTKTSKRDIHLKKLQLLFPIENCKTFILGISGGDCAGKREMIQYMFDKEGENWIIKDSKEPIAILHQEYFLNCSDGTQFQAKGTDWESFYKCARNLMIGNEQKIDYKKGGKSISIVVKPTKLLVIQGSHIFMSDAQTKHLSSLINLRVFIDSDSDVRLSRRIFKDTQQDKQDINISIQNYLDFIKPSYEKQIEPTKKECDIIVPHFGGGFDDHRKQNKLDYSSNIKNVCVLILAHLNQEMKKFEEEEIEQTQDEVKQG